MYNGKYPRQDLGYRNISYTRYSKKRIYPNLYRFVWRRHVGAYPNGLQKREFIPRGTHKHYRNTFSNT